MSWDKNGDNGGGDGGDEGAPPSTRWVRIPSPTRNDGPTPAPQPVIQRPPPSPATYGAGSPLSVQPPVPDTGFMRRESSRARVVGLLLVSIVVLTLIAAAMGLAMHLRDERGAGDGSSGGTAGSSSSGGSSGAGGAGGSGSSGGSSGSGGASSGVSGGDSADTAAPPPAGKTGKASKSATKAKGAKKPSGSSDRKRKPEQQPSGR